MLVYLVDNTIDGQGASPREVRAVLGRLIPGLEILIEPFHNVSLERVRSLRPSHIILSGQSHPWEMYTPESLAGVFAVIKQASQPILGICGGHQQIALAYGAKVGLMGRLEPGEGYDGAKRERGFLPVENTGEGLFKGLPSELTVWHNHCDEVKELPDGFRATASNETCQIQAMQQKGRALLSGRFHVVPDDLRAVAAPVLRHRILRNFQAEAEGVTTDSLVRTIVAHVQPPKSGL